MPANATKIEEIDARILEILGLSDAVDLEFDEYKTLLKESMMKGRMGGSTGMSTEDVEKVTDEWKRVKNDTGTFKVKSKAADFVSGKKPSPSKPKPQIDSSKLLPGKGGALSADIQPEEEDETGDFLRTVVAPSLDKIEKSLENILNFFKKQEELEERRDEKERVGEEKTGKKSREAELEETKEGPIKKTLDVVSKPVKGFFDMIWDFLKNILLGGALLALYDILKDPTKFVNNLIGMVNGVIGFLNNIINTISGPLLSPFNLIIDAFNTGMSWWNNSVNSVLGWFGQDPSNPPNPIPHLTLPNIPTIKPLDPGTIPGLEGGGEIVDIGFTEGGGIDSSSGITINGMCKDTQLIAAQPGEIMFSNPAVNYWGADTLLGMNELGGGTNIPKMGTPVLGATGGGIIQAMQTGGLVGGIAGKPSNAKNRPIFLHWNVGGYGGTAGSYHQLFMGSGQPRATGIDYSKDKTGHTGGHNDDSTALAVAAMKAIPGTYPEKYEQWPKPIQLTAMTNEAAALANAWGWTRGDVDKNVMTHGEWERKYVKSGKSPDGKVHKWDLDMLEDGPVTHPGGHFSTKQIKSKGGNILRGMIKSAMGGGGQTNLPEAQTPEGGSGPAPSIPSITPGSSPTIPGAPGAGQQNQWGNTTFIGGGHQQQQSQSSATSADQAPAQSVSSQDFNNAELIVIKSIYNLVG